MTAQLIKEINRQLQSLDAGQVNVPSLKATLAKVIEATGKPKNIKYSAELLEAINTIKPLRKKKP